MNKYTGYDNFENEIDTEGWTHAMWEEYDEDLRLFNLHDRENVQRMNWQMGRVSGVVELMLCYLHDVDILKDESQTSFSEHMAWEFFGDFYWYKVEE